MPLSQEALRRRAGRPLGGTACSGAAITFVCFPDNQLLEHNIMPSKLTVAVSKKIGLRDYGSLCATCGAEVELPSSLVFDDPEAFQRHARNAYAACARAVNDELARQQQASPESASSAQNGRHHPERQASGGNGLRASSKQLDYIGRLVDQIPGLGPHRLDGLAQKLFSRPALELTGFEASELIDMLKSIKAGELDLEKILNGAAT
jgi:hypothetical protein